uniref:Putative membrane protein n=1 Tax=Nonomuraea gerenzanensis TaxID=93944 RepID=A0A1M4EMY3_9ACTN|nr:acyltransferase [Nonomuraea gerenzanensis]SBP00201.1 putative membrane protein [Nonomuraea gerenzanensis]
MRELVARVEAATPAGRDRGVDGLRAVAILGVVAGHWLVTALVVDSGAVRAASPLRSMPELAPVSWLFQTLAVFFLVGGMVAARSRAGARLAYRVWLGRRMARLFRPVAAVVLVWVVIAVAMLAAGVRTETVGALARLVWSPLWFLLVFAVLTAATPLAARLHPAWPLAVVALVDLVRYGLDGPAWLGWVNVVAGWLVPYSLGASWGRGGGLPGRSEEGGPPGRAGGGGPPGRGGEGGLLRHAACRDAGPGGRCCSGAGPPPPGSSCGRVIRRPWWACRARRSRTSTRPPSPPSPSAWPSAERPCSCSAPCAGRCAGRSPGPPSRRRISPRSRSSSGTRPP